MKKLFFLIPIFIWADINPFGAGNLNSNNPYGLTPQEKAILQNKKEIVKLKSELDYLNNQISQVKLNLSNYNDIVNQKLAAFSTILNELNSTKNSVAILNSECQQQKEEIKKLKQKINSLENNLSAVKTSLKEISKIQNENFNILKNAIEKISITIQSIQKSNKPLSAKQAFIKAKRYFFSGKLNRAKNLFLLSMEKRYLPATSSYYLGEISYKKGKYKEALAYYKKSIEFYPNKTSFTPILLYHTGISFLQLGNKKAAKLTFEKLINDFPKSKYANFAKKELEKIK